MNNPRFVRRRKRRCYLNGDVERGYHRHLPFGQDLSQRKPFYELGGDEMRRVEIADLVYGDDVRMVERAGGSGFLFESEQPLIVFRALFEQQFESDLPFEPRVAGQIDLSHPAGAEWRDDLVTVEFCSDDNGHLETIFHIHMPYATWRMPYGMCHMAYAIWISNQCETFAYRARISRKT